MIRAVVDPGVLIAGLISADGTPSRLIREWLGGAFEMVVSPKLLEELELTLLRPKFRRWMSANDAAAFVALAGLIGSMVEDPPDAPRVSRDPADDYLVALALDCDAHVLVSGDADLTELANPPVPIVSPRRFLRLVAER